MACFGFLIPFLIRFVLYFGNNLTSSSDNSLRVEIAALAISRVNTVVLSDAFNRVNDFATLSMIRIFCLDNFTIFNIRHGLNTLHFYMHTAVRRNGNFSRISTSFSTRQTAIYQLAVLGTLTCAYVESF